MLSNRLYARPLQSWALSVFFNFFNSKKWFHCIFYQINNLFLQQSYLKSPLPVKLKKLKNTESAQLWRPDLADICYLGHGNSHDGPAVDWHADLHVKDEQVFEGSRHGHGLSLPAVAGPAGLSLPAVGLGGQRGGEEVVEEICLQVFCVLCNANRLADVFACGLLAHLICQGIYLTFHFDLTTNARRSTSPYWEDPDLTIILNTFKRFRPACC